MKEGPAGTEGLGTSSSILLGDVWLGTESGATPLLDSVLLPQHRLEEDHTLAAVIGR